MLLLIMFIIVFIIDMNKRLGFGVFILFIVGGVFFFVFLVEGVVVLVFLFG